MCNVLSDAGDNSALWIGVCRDVVRRVVHGEAVCVVILR